MSRKAWQRFSIAALACGAVGCAVTQLTSANVTRAVMAAELVQDGDSRSPGGISDTFGIEGYVYLYVVLEWDEPKRLGARRWRCEWYRGDQLLGTDDGQGVVGKSPSYLWCGSQAILLGPGEHSVNYYLGRNLLGSKAFRITE